MLYDELNFCGALAAPRWSWSSRGLGLGPHRVPLTRPRVVCHSGRSVVLLSRFARKLNGLVNQKVPPQPLPWKDATDVGRGKSKAPRLAPLTTAAALTGLAAGAATGAATLAVCVPVLGGILTKTTTGAAAGYLRHLFRRRSQLRDQATCGSFLLELPMVTETSGGRLVLEGMLLPQGLGPPEAEHVALLHFPSEEMAQDFLQHQRLSKLQEEVLEELEIMELQPKSWWRAYCEAFASPWFRLRKKPLPRRFCKASAALLAEQLVRLSGPVAVVHFISGATPELPPQSTTGCRWIRQAAASTLLEVCRAGGRGQYFASTSLGDAGHVELVVSLWKTPGKLLKYLRSNAAEEWPEEEGLMATAIEQLLVCPKL